MSTYTSENIQSLEFLEHIKKRPSAYIPDTSILGQYALIREVIDNSLDELDECVRISYSQPLYLEVNIYYDHKQRYLVSVLDTGRGVPHEKLIDVFTKQYTSGKFHTESYSSSSGLYGIGVKVPVALSDIFKVSTYRENKNTGFIKNNTTSGYVHDTIEDFQYPKLQSCTIVQFILSNRNFIDIDKFLEHGYLRIKELFERIALFSPGYNIVFNVFKVSKKYIDRFIDDIDIDLNTAFKYHQLKFHGVIDQFTNKSLDKLNYYSFLSNMCLKETNVSSDIISRFSESDFYVADLSIPKDKITNHKLNLAEIGILYPLKLKYFKNILPYRIGLVNNLILENSSDYHFNILVTKLKEKLASYIEDKNIRDFFLSSQYKLPFIYLANIKFSEAQFVGTTKHAFRDSIFKDIYQSSLENHFSTLDLKELFQTIEQHLISQYNRFFNKSISVKDNRRLLLELKRPTKYEDCLSNNRLETELFLVEGESAKSVDGRDENIQAIYTLGGKPCNAILELGKENQSLETLKKNPIFQDIMLLLNIKPNDPNLDSLRFGKIFIASDADTHGYHIASILLSNLMLFNKYLVTNGHLYIVIPPLFSLKFKSIGKSKKVSLYIRSEAELVYTLTDYIYQEVFDLYVKTPKTKNIVKLDFDIMVAFLQMTFDICKELENVSKLLNIPLLVVEALANVAHLLNKSSLTSEDVNTISSILKTDVLYDSNGHLLIIQIGIKDHIVPLINFNELYYAHIYPLLSKIDWFNLELYISKKGDKNNINPISLVQLYEICKSFDKLYTIERYKGLGSMDSKDRKISCLDPKTRTVHQITDIGDLDTIYGMLGVNSDYRKHELIENL